MLRRILPFLALAASVHAQTTFSFEGDIAPLFTKNGCNNSSCQRSLKGQNGFRRSVFGYDPAADYKQIVKDAGGRRVDLKDPEKSLILLKPTFQVKHGGGVRFSKTSHEYKLILEWLKQGAPEGVPGPKLVSLRIVPEEEIFLTAAEQTAQLKVTGRYADGVEKDLTREVNYVSNDDSIAAVDANGVVSVRKSGETAIMVRSLGVVNAARVAVSLRTAQANYQRPKSANYIDDFIFEKAERLRIVPSDLTGDAEY